MSDKQFWQDPTSKRDPPWPSEAKDRPYPGWGLPWHRKRRALLARLAGVLFVIALLVLAGMAILSFLITRLFGGDGETALLVWIGGCSLALALPLVAVGVAVRAFRGVATPLARIMAAADAVAAGDLNVRVPEQGPGEFRRLAQSFNHMTEELVRADQQRRNLTADVAHELRTPLHIIQGNLEGILDGVYQPTPDHLNATLDETRLLARLVDDLRTLSLAETGQLPLKREPVDIGELLADVQTSFSGQAEAAGVAICLEVEDVTSELTISADAGRLDQVLGNLVANALRHTPPGGAIELGVEPIGTGVRITVRDTGQGIPPEDLPYIFDRFWRGDRSRFHAEGVGGGLGLAIARQLIQAHRGRITVESQTGQGTTFTIELPN